MPTKPSAPSPQLSASVDLIHEITQAVSLLAKAEALADVAEVVERATRLLTGADGATFTLRNHDSESYLNDQHLAALSNGQEPPLDDGVHGECMSSQAPIIIPDIDADPRKIQEIFTDTTVKSLLVIPISETPIGTIGAYWSEKHDPTIDEVKLLQSLADSASRTLQNINSQKEMEALVEERIQALKAVNEELETFAYTVAHDLKNPLAVVKTNSWTLKELFGNQMPEKALQCVSRVEDASNRMRDLIDGMLAMYRVTKDVIVPEQVDLSETGNQILSLLQEQNSNNRTRFSIKEGMKAYGDSRMLRVVLENLLGNSWKYSSHTESPKIEFSAEIHEKHGEVFFIRDNGAGFNMADKDKLFALFKRLHPDSEFQGTGVGLASVQRILNKHGGTIWAEGAEGKGATFYFTLPTVPVMTKLGKTLEIMGELEERQE